MEVTAEKGSSTHLIETGDSISLPIKDITDLTFIIGGRGMGRNVGKLDKYSYFLDSGAVCNLESLKGLTVF